MFKFISILLCIQNIKATESILTSQLMAKNHKNQNEEIFHKDLFKKLYQQKAFREILMINVNNQCPYCHNILKWLSYDETPVIIMNWNKTIEYRKEFSNEILAIACSSAYSHNVLEQLATILNDMRYTRIIFIMDRLYLDFNQLRDFFKYCHKLKMLNVVVILKNFYKTHEYSQYTIFPEFQLELDVYQPSSRDFRILPDRLKDLKGYKLRTIVDHLEPRSLEYYDKNNNTVLAGYIGRFIKTVAEALNATLFVPVKVPFDIILVYRDIIQLIEDFSLDIPITSLIVFDEDNIREFSYPFEFGKWCILLPMAKSLENKEMFLMILKSPVICLAFILISLFTVMFVVASLNNKYYGRKHIEWPKIFINDVAIRGVLSQSFVFSARQQLSVKQIFCMLLLSGLTVSTLFNSYLRSFSTHPPFETEIQNYDDLLASDLKVVTFEVEFNYFHNLTNGSLSFLYEKFLIFSDYAEFSNLRDSFDSRYAYTVATSKMFYYVGLEAFYRTKFFRYSSDMCLSTMMHYVIPLGKNSFFLERLHELTLNIIQSGLLDFWMKSKSFEDVAAAGKVIKVNITHAEDKKPLSVKDFHWIWL